MNGTWQNITQSINLSEPIQANLVLAPDILAQADGNSLNQLSQLSQIMNKITIVDTITAIGILVIGWIVAWFISYIVVRLFKKTDIDNKIASWVTGNSQASQNLPVEKWISSVGVLGHNYLCSGSFL